MLCLAVLAGCSGDDAAASVDAAVDVLYPDSPPLVPCSTTTSATVQANGKTYSFAGLGNIDAGGEANCSGPPEAIAIYLGMQPIDAQTTVSADFLYLSQPLPVSSGPRTVTVTTNAGDISATLYVTTVTVAGAGPGLMEVSGTLSGSVSGDFTASHCSQLDVMCI